MSRIEQPGGGVTDQSASHNEARVTTLDAGRNEAAGAGEPDSDFPGEAEFKAAVAHFSFGAGRIGAPADYKTPFTRQLKSDTALRFDIDKKHFDEANKVESEVISSYLMLRLTTFVLFVLTLVSQVSLFEAAFVPENPPTQIPVHVAAARGVIALLPLESTVAAVVLILIVTAAAVAARMGIRRVWFYVLSRRAQQLSFEVFTHLHEINTRVTEVCAKVRDRVGKGGDWSSRARKWTIIALWNAKRGEYLDRFVTTVIWKVRTSIQQIENGSLVAKMLAVVIAAITLMGGLYSVPFVLLLLAQTFVFWHWWGRQPPDFWTTQFRKSAPGGHHEGEAYVDKISGVVENLVHEALSKEFGQGSTKKP